MASIFSNPGQAAPLTIMHDLFGFEIDAFQQAQPDDSVLSSWGSVTGNLLYP